MNDDKSPADVLAELANVPSPNAAYLDSMKRVIASQKQMLDGFQSNLDKWFERRREGAEAAIDMLTELNGTTDHEKRAEAWQRWASGAMARIMEDVQTQFEMMSKISGQLAEKGDAVPPEEMQKPEPAAKNVRPLFKDGTGQVRTRNPQNNKRK
ncbi:MAG: hypothetical protein ABL973_00615 [Micropepsaceae bacterium]